MTPPPRALVILGPTAAGKTSLGIEVARLLHGEIISADSRQAYRGLEVGTAAPSAADRSAVPHHGVAFLEPGERYGAGRFARLCLDWIDEIQGRGRTPIVVGGTGFFVRAVTRPVFREPELDSARRASLQSCLDRMSLHEMRRWTERLDPALKHRLPVIDRQRAGRSIELALLSGRSLTWWQQHSPPEVAPVHARTWVLELEPETLRRRIAARAQSMVGPDWVSEVRDLVTAGHGPDSPAMKAIGYRDVWRYASGEISRDEAVAAIVRETWQYARRQRTWLRHQLEADAVRIDGDSCTVELATRIAADWRNWTGEARGPADGEPA